MYICAVTSPDRKQAEEALRYMDQELRELGGPVSTRIEGERVRLSQELHDDVGQRVALLAAELGVLAPARRCA